MLLSNFVLECRLFAPNYENLGKICGCRLILRLKCDIIIFNIFEKD